MKIKSQTTYDLKTEKFKYLTRIENERLSKVDINELNKRLNNTKRANFYNTTAIALICFSALVALSIISIKL
jgi:hypothetical protein